MALLIPNASEVTLLKFMCGNTAPATTWHLRLFVSNTTPASGDTAATYTEMSTQGYAAKTLTNTSWSVSTVTVQARATYAEQTFVFDGTGGLTNVYGYYLTDDTGGLLLWAERFTGAPIVVPATYGGEIKVTPQLDFATLGDL